MRITTTEVCTEIAARIRNPSARKEGDPKATELAELLAAARPWLPKAEFRAIWPKPCSSFRRHSDSLSPPSWAFPWLEKTLTAHEGLYGSHTDPS